MTVLPPSLVRSLAMPPNICATVTNAISRTCVAQSPVPPATMAGQATCQALQQPPLEKAAAREQTFHRLALYPLAAPAAGATPVPMRVVMEARSALRHASPSLRLLGA